MSSSRRRSYVDIIAEILSVAREGARITNIVYKTNLNFQRAAKYLEILTKNGLISVSFGSSPTNKVIYRTTEKGMEFLSRYKKLQEILSELTSGVPP